MAAMVPQQLCCSARQNGAAVLPKRLHSDVAAMVLGVCAKMMMLSVMISAADCKNTVMVLQCAPSEDEARLLAAFRRNDAALAGLADAELFCLDLMTVRPCSKRCCHCCNENLFYAI